MEEEIKTLDVRELFKHLPEDCTVLFPPLHCSFAVREKYSNRRCPVLMEMMCHTHLVYDLYTNFP